MPDDLRAELEDAAAKRGRTLSGEMLWRLRVSLNRERIDRQDQVMRALNFLFSDLAEKINHRQGGNWHRDPFMFKAFKLAVAKLLDALEPPGEVRSPYHPAVRENDGNDFMQQLAEWFKTPESAAMHVAGMTIDNLFRPKKMTAEEAAVLGKVDSDKGMRLTEEFEREYFAMDLAGRVLGVDQLHVSGVFASERAKKGE